MHRVLIAAAAAAAAAVGFVLRAGTPWPVAALGVVAVYVGVAHLARVGDSGLRDLVRRNLVE